MKAEKRAWAVEVKINGTSLKVGDKAFCKCEHEVLYLRPAYHPETKKHLVDHKLNKVSFKINFSNECLIHHSLFI